ncbi:MAG: insulinase family protein, partial [Candidatus Latescibacterota bacterium]
MKKTALRAVLFAFLAAAVSVAAPAFVRAAEPLVARLGNGLEVILLENHGSPMIAATTVVRAGADLETAATSGASHMMEHLLFNGTERRTQKELYDEVDLYGIYNNATTRRSHTDYFVLVSKDRIREAMDIQADMLFHSTFPVENFEKEKGIVLEEMGKDEEDPGYIAEQLFRNAAFAGTPYARPILGSRKSIAGMSREDVVRYWRATYVPSNMTLFVMGDFDAEAMLAVVDSIYGAAEAGAPPEHPNTPFPPIGEGGPVRVFHGKTEEGQLSVAFLPGVYAVARPGIQDALTAYIGKRLSEDLAEGDEPVAFSVGASYERRTPPSASLAIGTTKERMDGFGRPVLSATFDPSRSPEEIEAALLASLRKIAESEPDPDEIERFRVSMKTSDIYLSEKPHMYGMMKAESIAEGGYDAIEEGGVALDSIGPASIRNLIARLVPENSISVAFLPGEPDYAEADLETAVPGEKPIWEAGPLPEAAPTKVAASAAPGAPSGGLAILRAPAKGGAARAARSERVDTTLANGLRIVVQSNDDSEVFAIHMLARHRSWQEPAGLSGIADCLHRLLLKGAGDSDGPALRARLERIGAEVKAHDESFIPYD